MDKNSKSCEFQKKNNGSILILSDASTVPVAKSQKLISGHSYIRSCFYFISFGGWIWYIYHHHYDDVIMGAMASQIASLTIVYSTVYSDANQRKHQSSASLAFVRGIHRGPNSPHKWPVTRKMFPFDDVIMPRTGTIARCIGRNALKHWGRDKMAATLEDGIFKCNFVNENV